MEGIKITKRPLLKNPYSIVAWPGMGEVAFRAASYLVEKLKAIEFAEIPAHEYFYLTGSNVRNGVLEVPELPAGKFYYFKNPILKPRAAVREKIAKNDLIIFLSNAQPDLAKAESYCEKILSLAKSFKVKTIFSFAAMPQPIDHTHPPQVWFTSTAKELNTSLEKFNLKPLIEGQISGMNGLFLGIAKRYGFLGVCLLGEIPLYTIQIENPKASAVVLEVLGRILNIQLDLSGLLEQAHHIDDEINKLMEYLKLAPPQAGPIEEEDIEKIKKSLSQLTKLPASVKEKIEQLFILAKTDLVKANELKSELDKWNVYKEYEDRFLDLFKKQKHDNN